MSQTTGTSRRPSRSNSSAPKPGGRAIVADYVGCAASEATQAIRRAGLRPGLERSYGYVAELTGQVVSQEPEAQSELPRGSLVRIYVAAPAPQELPDSTRDHGGQTHASAAPPRRGLGPAGQSLLEQASQDQQPDLPRSEAEVEPPAAETASSESDAVGGAVVSEDELERAGEVFAAAHESRSWAAIVGGGLWLLLGRLRQRRWVVRVVVAVVVVWLLVAVLTTFIRGSAPGVRPHHRMRPVAGSPARGSRVGASDHHGRRPRRSLAMDHLVQAAQGAPSSVSAGPVRGPAVAVAAGSGSSAPVDGAPSESSSELPPAEQVGGGPFSP